MPRSLRSAILIIGLLLVAFLAVIVRAGSDSNIMEGFGRVMDEWWGIATICDLYLGLTFVGVWIAVVEKNKRLVPLWFLALYTLGNLATLVYLLLRARRAATFRDLFLPRAIPNEEN